jgi:DNA-binding transcriptional regulator YiaG
MFSTSHGPNSINSLLLCAQAALLDGVVSNRDVINVLDVAQDLVSLSINNATNNENVNFPQIQNETAPACTPNYSDLILGDRILLARENLGLTEADLARLLNTYSDHISDWECGITEPAASMIIPLANALKCDPMWLLTGESVAVARES